MERIVSGDRGYPSGILDLETPPPLWLIGSSPRTPSIAVVGSRRATRYGLRLSRAFGKAIARSGWSTVSGLARGVDAAAHSGAIGGGGHTTAVMGCGADVCYPSENRGLYEALIESGGSILSEYSPGTPPDRWRFPARNRLIAAMAAAVVVVEAGETGGALITARLGAEIGRPVFAVPGDVDREMSAGSNRLIRDGAHPVFGAADLIEELSLVIGPPARHQMRSDGIPEQGVSIDDLAARWNVPMSEALARLGRMELDGLVRKVGESIFPM